MPKVALVETKPSKTNFAREFEGAFEFDQYQLCSDPGVKKVLKRDCDIDMNPDDYDWVVLVGSYALKYYTKINSVTEYSGKKVEDKFLPVINPSMLAFKPEARRTWDDSKDHLIQYISGEIEDVVINEEIAFGIQDTEQANEFIRAAIKAECGYVALDSETTGLYPRDGYMLGISLSYDGKCGAYIDTDCFDYQTEALLQQLFDEKKVIFHNAKFDMAFFEYHFNLSFLSSRTPCFFTTSLMRTRRTWTKSAISEVYSYGDYEKPMYDWIDQYRKETGILKADFQWSSIPFDIMKTYAAMDQSVHSCFTKSL